MDNFLIASADQIRSEIDVYRLLGTTAIQSDGGSALILSRTPSDMTLDSAYNYSDTANWLGRLDNVESNKSFFFYDVRLIRRLLKEAEIEPGSLASCLPPGQSHDIFVDKSVIFGCVLLSEGRKRCRNSIFSCPKGRWRPNHQLLKAQHKATEIGFPQVEEVTS